MSRTGRRSPHTARATPLPQGAREGTGMRNIRIVLEFDGTGYAGWQVQPDRPTIQGAVEAALKQILGRQTRVFGCGRTDAGVSARNYVANFFTGSTLSCERLKRALNFYLPRDILVKSVADCPPDFHARYSCRSKTYCYRIIQGRSPLRRRHGWELNWPIDPERMRRAARLLLGRRDWRPFCQTRDENGTCRLTAIRIEAKGDEVLVTVQGDRFLYKMVRRIVGALVAYGTGRLTLKELRAALAGRPSKPFPTAPAQGLTLQSVDY
ncbi:MAG: tRNA pseudouridine(38-40) synthase TruA [candidate division WOR-3 bacterium]